MDKRFRILAVDDEPINIQLIKAALKEDYDFLTAMNGHEAVEQLELYKPDIILLDVLMPELNGFEVCSIIKADERYVDIPIIFMTALDTHEGALQGLELGAVDYLTKPVNIELLKLRVRNHLVMKEQRDLLEEQNIKLEAALAQVKMLEGIIPICSYCKKIRDDKNSWHQLEEYISNHSEALFSHGICPECYAKEVGDIKKRTLL